MTYFVNRRFLGVRQLAAAFYGHVNYLGFNNLNEGGSKLPHSKEVVIQLRLLCKII